MAEVTECSLSYETLLGPDRSLFLDGNCCNMCCKHVGLHPSMESRKLSLESQRLQVEASRLQTVAEDVLVRKQIMELEASKFKDAKELLQSQLHLIQSDQLRFDAIDGFFKAYGGTYTRSGSGSGTASPAEASSFIP